MPIRASALKRLVVNPRKNCEALYITICNPSKKYATFGAIFLKWSHAGMNLLR